MILTSDVKDYGIAGLSLIILGGVVREFMRRVRGTESGERPKHEAPDGRLHALEIKIQKASDGVVKAEASIVDLEKLIDQRSESLDQKMEVMLSEMKGLSDRTEGRHAENREDWAKLWGSFNEAYRLVTERLARIEQNVENLEKTVDRVERDKTHRGGGAI